MEKNLTKSQKGAIGEHLVASKLLEYGLDVFMANMSINNTKSYDLLAVTPDTPKTYFIQVKFNSTGYFNASMNIEQVLDKNYLSSRIVGPCLEGNTLINRLRRSPTGWRCRLICAISQYLTPQKTPQTIPLSFLRPR